MHFLEKLEEIHSKISYNHKVEKQRESQTQQEKKWLII